MLAGRRQTLPPSNQKRKTNCARQRNGHLIWTNTRACKLWLSLFPKEKYPGANWDYFLFSYLPFFSNHHFAAKAASCCCCCCCCLAAGLFNATKARTHKSIKSNKEADEVKQARCVCVRVYCVCLCLFAFLLSSLFVFSRFSSFCFLSEIFSVRLSVSFVCIMMSLIYLHLFVSICPSSFNSWFL